MDESLSSLYAKADALRRQIDDGLIQDLQSHLQDCITLYEHCKQLVERLALFSTNESIDDVASSELKYFLIDYYLGELTEKRFTTIDERNTLLLKAKEYYNAFVSRLQSYSILPPEPKEATNPADIRAAKVAEYKRQKSLAKKISELESQQDEEDLRAWTLASIELAVLRTRQNLNSIAAELDLIRSRRPQPIQSQPEPPNQDRLDQIPASSLPKSGPLLSGQGKVLRPFVLTSKRDQLARGVFRPDHSLPTMSVDEYLVEEIRRGGIQVPQEEDGIRQGGRVKTTQEEEEEEDRETMKKREWDEFVDSHAKGSGNMGFNRG